MAGSVAQKSNGIHQDAAAPSDDNGRLPLAPASATVRAAAVRTSAPSASAATIAATAPSAMGWS